MRRRRRCTRRSAQRGHPKGSAPPASPRASTASTDPPVNAALRGLPHRLWTLAKPAKPGSARSHPEHPPNAPWTKLRTCARHSRCHRLSFGPGLGPGRLAWLGRLAHWLLDRLDDDLTDDLPNVHGPSLGPDDQSATASPDP